MSAPLCRYFQRGHCNYGSQCKFLHPGHTTLAGNGGTSFGGGEQAKINNYTLPSLESIRVDLQESPQWLLSSYGPGRDPPSQLIDGKDVSFEEVRLLAYDAQARGNTGVYEQEWIRLNNDAEAQQRTIMNNLQGATDFLKQQQANRLSVYKYKQPNGNMEGPSGGFGQPQRQNPFAAPAAPAAPTAGAFGQPAFGQPAQMGASPFPGASSAPAFGQPAFGQSSAIGGGAFSAKPAQPAFGQPAFGQTSTPQSAFGTPPFVQPAFGQSGFGQQTQQQSAFGQPGQPAFGQTSTPQGAFGAKPAQPAFGQPAFSQTSQPQSTFGQPAFGQTAQPGVNPSPFAAAAQQNQNQSQSTTPFGAFAQQNQGQGGASAAAPNPFGRPQQQQTGPSPITQASPFQQGQQQPVQPIVTSAFGSPVQQQPQPPQNSASPFSNSNPFQSGSQQPPPTPATPGKSPIGAPRGTPGKAGKWGDPVIEYTQREIEAFRASHFDIGNVPMVAPSREMCF